MIGKVCKMKLIELLEVLSLETPIGIWNIDNKREKCPRPQAYTKAKNIPFKKLRNLYDMDVMGVCVNKAGGLMIRIYDKERLARSLAHYDLARKIKEVDS